MSMCILILIRVEIPDLQTRSIADAPRLADVAGAWWASAAMAVCVSGTRPVSRRTAVVSSALLMRDGAPRHKNLHNRKVKDKVR